MLRCFQRPKRSALRSLFKKKNDSIKIYKIFNSKYKGEIEEGLLLRKNGKAFLMIQNNLISVPENENVKYQYETEYEQKKFFELMLFLFGNNILGDIEIQKQALSMCNLETIKDFLKEHHLIEIN